MKRAATTFLMGAYMASIAAVSVAQDQKMLSDGQSFALRSVEPVPGQGLTGAFAYRSKEGKWETAFTMTCEAIRSRTAFMAALDTQIKDHPDLAEKTGVAWPKLESDVLNAMNKLFDACNLNSNAAPPIKTGRMEP